MLPDVTCPPPNSTFPHLVQLDGSPFATSYGHNDKVNVSCEATYEFPIHNYHTLTCSGYTGFFNHPPETCLSKLQHFVCVYAQGVSSVDKIHDLSKTNIDFPKLAINTEGWLMSISWGGRDGLQVLFQYLSYLPD